MPIVRRFCHAADGGTENPDKHYPPYTCIVFLPGAAHALPENHAAIFSARSLRTVAMPCSCVDFFSSSNGMVFRLEAEGTIWGRERPLLGSVVSLSPKPPLSSSTAWGAAPRPRSALVDGLPALDKCLKTAVDGLPVFDKCLKTTVYAFPAVNKYPKTAVDGLSALDKYLKTAVDSLPALDKYQKTAVDGIPSLDKHPKTTVDGSLLPDRHATAAVAAVSCGFGAGHAFGHITTQNKEKSR